MKKKRKSYRKWIIVGIIVLTLVLLFVFGTQAYLYVRLLVGNDLLLTLSVDNNRFFLEHGESANVSAVMRGTANPFCKASCTLSLKDLSTGAVLENQTFTRGLPLQERKEYTLEAPLEGSGQKLYYVEAQCSAASRGLCRTAGDIKLRSIILVLNYTYTPAEEALRESNREELSQMLIQANSWIEDLILFDTELHQLPVFIDYSSEFATPNLLSDMSQLNITLYDLKVAWELDQEITVRLAAIRLNVAMFESLFNLRQSLVLNITERYNQSIASLVLLKTQFDTLQGAPITVQDEQELTDLGANAMHVLYPGNTTMPITDFSTSVQELTQRGELLYSRIVLETNLSTNKTLNTSLPSVPYAPIAHHEYNSSYTPEFSEVAPQCCINMRCYPCCTDCRAERASYPVILLHGHTFNKGISAEFSLDTFGALQHELGEEGYVNGGILLSGAQENDSRGVLGELKTAMLFRASYYFDIYSNTKNTLIIETKEDNLDSYAIRLRDNIDTIRYLTGRDKVVIVAHSMGGLVVRRYMQVFGDDAVEKVIFIATPNHGISGRAQTYCDFLGASAECRDMQAESLFINKINRAPTPNVTMENIIGVGCPTDGDTGDGIVTNASAYLERVPTHYVKVTCDAFLETAHTLLVDPRHYPEVYRIVNDSLHALS